MNVYYLSYVYRNDIEINLIESDTEVKWVKNLKAKEILKVFNRLKGLGGYNHAEGFDYVVEHFLNSTPFLAGAIQTALI